MMLAFALSLCLSQTDGGAAASEAPAADAPVAEKAPQHWYEKVDLSGYARLSAGYTFPLGTDTLVGGNGGFRVANFRLGLMFSPIEHVSAFASAELSAPLPDATDPLAGRRGVELRDAWVQYTHCDCLSVRVGQFRPAFFAETLVSDEKIPFISRSIVSEGLTAPEGYGPRAAIALDRQVGLQVFSKRLGNKDGFGYSYGAGIFNGNGPNQLFNDNNAPMGLGRVEAHWADLVTVGANLAYDVASQGVRPNRIESNVLTYGADATLHLARVDAMLGYLGRSTKYGYGGLGTDSSTGLVAQVHYLSPKTGIEAAARFAFVDPSGAQSQDAAMEIAAMVGWRPFQLPFRVLAQFTHREEDSGVGYPNDSVDVMLHATW